MAANTLQIWGRSSNQGDREAELLEAFVAPKPAAAVLQALSHHGPGRLIRRADGVRMLEGDTLEAGSYDYITIPGDS